MLKNRANVIWLALLLFGCREVVEFDNYLLIETSVATVEEAQVVTYGIVDQLDDPYCMGSYFFEKGVDGNYSIFWQLPQNRGLVEEIAQLDFSEVEGGLVRVRVVSETGDDEVYCAQN